MVSQAVTESQEEDVQESSNAKAAADKSMHSQAAAVSTDSTGKEKVLAKLKHELDKRLDSSDNGEQKSTADSDSDNNDKEDPDIEYKLRTKGVQVHDMLHETPLSISPDWKQRSHTGKLRWVSITPVGHYQSAHAGRSVK